jgi:hypothetical protein
MPGIFLFAYHTTADNIALPKSLIGTRAGLAQRQWPLPETMAADCLSTII